MLRDKKCMVHLKAWVYSVYVYVCVQLRIHNSLFPPPSGPPLRLLTSIWTQCTWTFLHPASMHIHTYIPASRLLPLLPRLRPLPVLPCLPPAS